MREVGGDGRGVGVGGWGGGGGEEVALGQGLANHRSFAKFSPQELFFFGSDLFSFHSDNTVAV